MGRELNNHLTNPSPIKPPSSGSSPAFAVLLESYRTLCLRGYISSQRNEGSYGDAGRSKRRRRAQFLSLKEKDRLISILHTGRKMLSSWQHTEKRKLSLLQQRQLQQVLLWC